MEDQELQIIRIEKKSSPTGAAYNQFARYRSLNYLNSFEHFITLQKSDFRYDDYGENIEFYNCDGSYFKLMRYLFQILKANKKEKLIFHHHYASLAFVVLIFKWAFRPAKHVYTIHSTYKNYKLHNKYLSRINSYLSDKVIFCGNESYDSFSELVIKPKKSKLYKITNGVDIERVESANVSSESKYNDEKLKILVISRNDSAKNIPFLLKIFKELSPEFYFELQIIGPINKEVKRMIQNHPMQNRIIINGRVPRNDVYKKMQASDIFVSTSLWEGLPIAVLEAMASGLPIILSDIPPHREVHNMDESTIILPFDVDVWKKNLNYLASLKPKEREDLGGKNKIFVQEKFSLEAMHENYDKLYRDLTDVKRNQN